MVRRLSRNEVLDYQIKYRSDETILMLLRLILDLQWSESGDEEEENEEGEEENIHPPVAVANQDEKTMAALRQL